MHTALRTLASTAVLTALSLSLASAKLVQRDIEYTDEKGTVLQGYLAYEEEKGDKLRPGVVVVHDWLGIRDETKSKADALAKLGYIAFAADVYGKGVRPDKAGAGKLAGTYKGDRALFRERLRAATATLLKQPGVDPKRIAAIGYCFGGTGVVEMARDGQDLLGIVTFHGGLDSEGPDDGKAIKAKVLALCGADDPFVPATDMVAFEDDLKTNKIDYQIVKYSGTVHSFTDKTADGSMKGAQYNESSDKRSWQAMKDFLVEIFGEKKG